jgi:putative tryptophan/tyrosine transport system substrate-binding protein
MDRRAFLAGSAALLAAPLAAEGQQSGKVPLIGILRTGSPPDPFIEAFRRGLHELGYAEDRNIRLEYRWAEGKTERLPELAADLVRLKVNVLVASGQSPAVAAKQATATIPIVMPVSTDPVGLGLAASLARPGGNVTGLITQNDELTGKWLELLKETLPRVSRVAVLWDVASSPQQLSGSESAARALGLRLHALKVRRGEDFATAFAEAQKTRAEALVVLASPVLWAHRTLLVELAARHRLPTMYHQKDFVVGSGVGSGGLMSYGADLADMFRRAATYVDKILKGARPSDLPIEQPTKFELVINLKTAKTLGLTIPPSVLARADQVIE